MFLALSLSGFNTLRLLKKIAWVQTWMSG